MEFAIYMETQKAKKVKMLLKNKLALKSIKTL